MRKLGMVVLVVCLLGTVPVTAAETQAGGGWWDGVVAWMVQVWGPWKTGPNLEPNGADQLPHGSEGGYNDTGPAAEPNGLEQGDGNDTGPNLEPNG